MSAHNDSATSEGSEKRGRESMHSIDRPQQIELSADKGNEANFGKKAREGPSKESKRRTSSDIESRGAKEVEEEPWLKGLDESCVAVLCEIAQDSDGHCVVLTSKLDHSNENPSPPEKAHKDDAKPLIAVTEDLEQSDSNHSIDWVGDPRPEIHAAPERTEPQNDTQTDDNGIYRLLLVEGLSKGLVQHLKTQGLELPSSFYQNHMEGIRSNNNAFDPYETLHLPWIRTAMQTTEQWTISQSFQSKGRRWPGVPNQKGIISETYNRLPVVHRSYETLDSRLTPYMKIKLENGTWSEGLVVACQQVCSIKPLDRKSNTLGLDSIVLFDAPRKYRVNRTNHIAFKKAQKSDKTVDSFHQFEGDQHRYISRLRDIFHGKNSPMLPLGIAEYVLMTMVFEDQSAAVSKLGETLDKIDMDMASDTVVQDSIKGWRKMFGTWRFQLNHIDEFVDPLKAVLEHLGQQGAFSGVTPASDIAMEMSTSLSIPGNAWDRLGVRLSYLQKRSVSARQRCEATFAALMSTMTIIESEMAIREAAEVSKLTKLAFFFIPLTFVASICGMNLAEFQDGNNNHLTVWIWVVCSAGVLLSTYFVLYYSTINKSIANFFKVLRRGSHMYSTDAVSGLAVISFFIGSLGAIAGLGVAIWATVRLSPWSHSAKIGAIIGFVFATPGVIILFAFFLEVTLRTIDYIAGM